MHVGEISIFFLKKEDGRNELLNGRKLKVVKSLASFSLLHEDPRDPTLGP